MTQIVAINLFVDRVNERVRDVGVSLGGVRPEIESDRPAIRQVNEAAFGRPEEGLLVDALRDSGALWLSLVAEMEGRVVGHCAWSPVTLDEEGPAGRRVVTPYTGIGLGPVAVLPAYQRKGIGTALVFDGLHRCEEAGWLYAIVLGHPGYYPRFGFRPSSPLGIRCEFDAPAEEFMVMELRHQALLGRRGVVRYRPEFHEVSY